MVRDRKTDDEPRGVAESVVNETLPRVVVTTKWVAPNGARLAPGVYALSAADTACVLAAGSGHLEGTEPPVLVDARAVAHAVARARLVSKQRNDKHAEREVARAQAKSHVASVLARQAAAETAQRAARSAALMRGATTDG